MSKKKDHRIRKKSYGSLSELRNEIQRDNVEKVKDFCGHSLLTNRHTYSMVDGQIYVDGVLNGTN